MAIYLYARVSTARQRVERQIANLVKAFPDGIVYSEKFTGTRMERPEWSKIMRKVRAGDMICFDEVSRMSRTAQEGFETYKELFEKGISLVFLKEPHINTDTYKKAMEGAILSEIKSGDANTDELVSSILNAVNRFMMKKVEEDIYAAFASAQKEVDYLHQRTKEGIAAARAAGKQIGARPGVKRNIPKAASTKEFILKRNRAFGGPLNDLECMRLCEVSRNTYYKYKRELIEEIMTPKQGVSV